MQVTWVFDRHVGLLALAVLASLSAGASSAASSPNRCGSPEIASARLRATLERFKSGVTFEDVCTIQAPSVPPEYWGAPPRKEAGPWVIAGRDGARAVVQSLVCDFDSQDRLVACKSWMEPQHTQEISERAYDAVTVGESIDAVVAALCEPNSRSTEQSGAIVLGYWLVRPTAEPAHLRSCPVSLTFRDGVLVRKAVACK